MYNPWSAEREREGGGGRERLDPVLAYIFNHVGIVNMFTYYIRKMKVCANDYERATEAMKTVNNKLLHPVKL